MSTASRIIYDEFIAGDAEQELRLDEARGRLDLGGQLRARRESRDLTPAALAEVAGTDEATVARLEAGEFDADTYAALDRVAAALDAELRIALHPAPPTRAA